MTAKISRKQFIHNSMKSVGIGMASLALPGLATRAPAATVSDTGRVPKKHFRVRRHNGIWWFVSPDDNEQISLGINHVAPIFLLAPYNREATLERYGTDFVKEAARTALNREQESSITPSNETEPRQKANDFVACARISQTFNPHGQAARAWMQQIFADFADWGFDSLGFGTSIPRFLFRKQLPYVQSLRSARVAFYMGDLKESPDVFSEVFARRVDAAVRPVALDCAGDPNLIGYGFSDLPPWSAHEGFGDSRVPPWSHALRALPSNTAGKKEWIDVLRQRYPDAVMAARAHGTPTASWEALQAHTDWSRPADQKSAAADDQTFLARIADRWHQLHVEAIRKHDPHHLILGDKLYGGAEIPAFLFPVLKKWVDVVNIEWFGYFGDQEATLRGIHEATGKPILLGDSSFAHRQPNQEHERNIQCDSLDSVGQTYAGYLESALSQPYIVGWHQCGYIEGWKGIPHWLMAAQPGFKDPFENVHQEVIAHVRRANAQAHAWHANARY